MIVGGIDGNNDGSHVGQTLRQRLLGALADVLEALVRGRLHAGVVVVSLIRGTSHPRFGPRRATASKSLSYRVSYYRPNLGV